MKYCYVMYISQFKIYENGHPAKKGYHRHHIVPRSEQIETDRRCVYLLPSQHLWAHILYDRMTGAKTSCLLIGEAHLTKESIHSYEDCLILDEIDKEYRKAHSGENNNRYGKPAWNKGKTRVYTEETLQRMSEAQKGKTWSFFSTDGNPNRGVSRYGEDNHFFGKKHTDESKQKMSKSQKQRYQNGAHSPMKGRHHTEEARKILALKSTGPNNAGYGKHWYTNGVENIREYECPEGFHPGRTHRKRTA